MFFLTKKSLLACLLALTIIISMVLPALAIHNQPLNITLSYDPITIQHNATTGRGRGYHSSSVVSGSTNLGYVEANLVHNNNDEVWLYAETISYISGETRTLRATVKMWGYVETTIFNQSGTSNQLYHNQISFDQISQGFICITHLTGSFSREHYYFWTTYTGVSPSIQTITSGYYGS